MTKRLVVVLAAALGGLALVALLLPASPFYLPTLFDAGKSTETAADSSWREILRSPDPQVRQRAIVTLVARDDPPAEVVSALAAMVIEDPDGPTRGRAALALGKIAPVSRPAVPALAQALRDPEPVVRKNAAVALARLGELARPAIPALIEGLRDEGNQCYLEDGFTIREVVALALGRAGGGSGAAVTALAEVLKANGPEELRLAAARALGEIGSPARPAAPVLRALLQDPNVDIRLVAEESLRKLGDEAVSSGGGDLKRELPPAERTYLWEIEHHGNLLVKHGFGPLAEAIKRGDAAALTRMLAGDFAGTDLRRPHVVRTAGTGLEVKRAQDAGHPPVPVGRGAFVTRLLELRNVFTDKPPQVKFALMTLAPKVRGQIEGDWEGTAQLRLHGEHAPKAPAEVVIVLRLAFARPTQERLAHPGWLRAAGVQQTLTAKAPAYLFAEVARQRGLDPSRCDDGWTGGKSLTTPKGAYVCDFDRDGILDLLLTDRTGGGLFRGRPCGTFEDATAGYGLPPGALTGSLAAWIDIDGDGWEDLIAGTRVWRNRQGERFEEYTDRCSLRLTDDIVNAAVADYDGDGKLDLYLTRSARPATNSWLDNQSDASVGNALCRNLGGWKFRDVTRASGTAGARRSTFAAAWLDANNDGRPDLHVINEFGNGVLLVNRGDGRFRGHALADRPADFGSMGLAVGDVNNDGHIDIYCANMYSKAGTRVIGNLAPDAYPPPVVEKMRRFVAGSQLHLNQGGLRFEQVGPKMQVAAVGWAYGPCLADLDNDGWLDIYATAGFVSRNRDEPDG